MLAKVKETLVRLHRDEQGAMSIEAILLIALIALPIIIALFAFRKSIVTWFNDRAVQLNGTD